MPVTYPDWLEAIRDAAQAGRDIAFGPDLFPAGSLAAAAATRQLAYVTDGAPIVLAGTALLSGDEDAFVEISGTADFAQTVGAEVVVVLAAGEGDAPVFALDAKGYAATLSDLFSRMTMPAVPGATLTTLFPDLLGGMTLGLYSGSTQGPVIEIGLLESEEEFTALGYLHLTKVGFSLFRGCISASEAQPDPAQDTVSVSLSGGISVGSAELTSPLYVSLDLPDDSGTGIWAVSLLMPSGVRDITVFVTTLIDDLFRAVGVLGPSGLSALVPGSFLDTSAFMVEQLTLTVRDRDLKPLSGAIAFSTSDSWIPVRGVILENAGLGIALDLSGPTPRATLSIGGSVQMGETAFFAAQAEVPVLLGSGPQPDWTLSLQGSVDMGSGAGNSLTAIPMFDGQIPLFSAGQLPDAFLQMESYVVTNFQLQFNPFESGERIIKHLELYTVANLQAGWGGILTMDSPKFDVTLDYPFDAAQRRIEANAGMSVKFGDHLRFDVAGGLRYEDQTSVWTVQGETTASFTLQEAAEDVRKSIVAVTGIQIDPVVAPPFLGGISVDQLAVLYTTEGPAATVDWAMTFPTPWDQPIGFQGHVGVTYAGRGAGGEAPAGQVPPDVGIVLRLDLTDNVHIQGDIDIGPGDDNPSATDTSVTLTASVDTPYTFEDMKAALNLTNLPAIPDGFDPLLSEMTFRYDSAAPTMSASMTSRTYGEAAVLVTRIPAPAPAAPPAPAGRDAGTLPVPPAEEPAQWSFGFGLNLAKRIDLANLPVLGEFIPGNLSFGFDNLALALARPGLPKAAAQQLFDDIGRPGGLGDWKGDFRTAMAVDLFVADHTLPLAFAFGDGTGADTADVPAPEARAKAREVAAADQDAPPVSGPDTTSWLDIQRSFGPLSVRRVGLSIEDGGMGFPVDVALSFAGMMIEADGLQVGLPFDGMSERFHLAGLGLSYDQAPIYVGAALKIASAAELAKWSAENGGVPIDFAFSGIAMLRASERFSLAGVGGYAQLADAPAFFVFAEAQAPLGGPPILQITGASAGLGVNYHMRQPTLDEVPTNPFVAGLFPKEGAGPLAVLNGLTSGKAPWLRISQGEFWLAAGLEFTIAQTLTNKAVAILSIGDPIQLGLYGISNLSVPKGAGVKLAEIEIAWAATLIPLEATVTAGGTLTQNSYILVRAARVTGSFWVYLRAKPGAEFMAFALGGFRNGYELQAVPKVPVPRLERIGFDWKYSNAIRITGGAYYALTPNAAMVGGSLHANFSFSAFRAWLDLNTNFLLNWQPQTFRGDIRVTVGASVTIKVWKFSKTFRGEFDVDIAVQGPPLQGVAKFRFMGIPINVSFGDRTHVPDDPTVGWPEFAAESLPPPAHRAKVRIGEGQLGSAGGANGAAALANGLGSEERSLATQSGFVVVAESFVPFERIEINGEAAATAGPIDIRPVGQSSVASTGTLTITRDGAPLEAAAMANWLVEPVHASAPVALWGAPNGGRPRMDEPGMLTGLLTGMRISTLAPDVSEIGYEIEGGRAGGAAGMQYAPIPLTDAALLPLPGPADMRGAPITDPSAARTQMEQIDGSAGERRGALHARLAGMGFAGLANGPLTLFAENADVILPTEPKLTGVPA